MLELKFNLKLVFSLYFDVLSKKKKKWEKTFGPPYILNVHSFAFCIVIKSHKYTWHVSLYFCRMTTRSS